MKETVTAVTRASHSAILSANSDLQTVKSPIVLGVGWGVLGRPVDQAAGYPVCVAVRRDDGHIGGVILAGLSLDWLSNFIAQKAVPAGAAIAITDWVKDCPSGNDRFWRKADIDIP